MLSSLLKKTLDKVLAEYVEGEYDVSVSLFGQHAVELDHLEVKSDTLNDLVFAESLPFRFKQVYVGRTYLDIPFSSLGSKPCKLYISDALVLLHPHLEGAWNEEKAVKNIDEALKSFISNLLAELHPESLDVPLSSEAGAGFGLGFNYFSGSGMLNRTLTRLLDNLEIVLERINVRVETPYMSSPTKLLSKQGKEEKRLYHGGFPLEWDPLGETEEAQANLLDLSLSSLTMITTNELWKPHFDDDCDFIVFKLFQLEQLNVSFTPKEPSLLRMVNDEAQRTSKPKTVKMLYEVYVENKKRSKEHRSMLGPVNAQFRTKLNTAYSVGPTEPHRVNGLLKITPLAIGLGLPELVHLTFLGSHVSRHGVWLERVKERRRFLYDQCLVNIAHQPYEEYFNACVARSRILARIRNPKEREAKLQTFREENLKLDLLEKYLPMSEIHVAIISAAKQEYGPKNFQMRNYSSIESTTEDENATDHSKDERSHVNVPAGGTVLATGWKVAGEKLVSRDEKTSVDVDDQEMLQAVQELEDAFGAKNDDLGIPAPIELDADEFEVIFDEAETGLILKRGELMQNRTNSSSSPARKKNGKNQAEEEDDEEQPVPVVVEGLVPGSQAAKTLLIEPGMVITAVKGYSVLDSSYEETLDQIKTVKRPFTIRFKGSEKSARVASKYVRGSLVNHIRLVVLVDSFDVTLYSNCTKKDPICSARMIGVGAHMNMLADGSAIGFFNRLTHIAKIDASLGLACFDVIDYLTDVNEIDLDHIVSSVPGYQEGGSKKQATLAQLIERAAGLGTVNDFKSFHLDWNPLPDLGGDDPIESIMENENWIRNSFLSSILFWDRRAYTFSPLDGDSFNVTQNLPMLDILGNYDTWCVQTKVARGGAKNDAPTCLTTRWEHKFRIARYAECLFHAKEEPFLYLKIGLDYQQQQESQSSPLQNRYRTGNDTTFDSPSRFRSLSNKEGLAEVAHVSFAEHQQIVHGRISGNIKTLEVVLHVPVARKLLELVDGLGEWTADVSGHPPSPMDHGLRNYDEIHDDEAEVAGLIRWTSWEANVKWSGVNLVIPGCSMDCVLERHNGQIQSMMISCRNIETYCDRTLPPSVMEEVHQKFERNKTRHGKRVENMYLCVRSISAVASVNRKFTSGPKTESPQSDSSKPGESQTRPEKYDDDDDDDDSMFQDAETLTRRPSSRSLSHQPSTNSSSDDEDFQDVESIPSEGDGEEQEQERPSMGRPKHFRQVSWTDRPMEAKNGQQQQQQQQSLIVKNIRAGSPGFPLSSPKAKQDKDELSLVVVLFTIQVKAIRLQWIGAPLAFSPMHVSVLLGPTFLSMTQAKVELLLRIGNASTGLLEGLFPPAATVPEKKDVGTSTTKERLVKGKFRSGSLDAAVETFKGSTNIYGSIQAMRDGLIDTCWSLYGYEKKSTVDEKLDVLSTMSVTGVLADELFEKVIDFLGPKLGKAVQERSSPKNFASQTIGTIIEMLLTYFYAQDWFEFRSKQYGSFRTRVKSSPKIGSRQQKDGSSSWRTSSSSFSHTKFQSHRSRATTMPRSQRREQHGQDQHRLHDRSQGQQHASSIGFECILSQVSASLFSVLSVTLTDVILSGATSTHNQQTRLLTRVGKVVLVDETRFETGEVILESIIPNYHFARDYCFAVGLHIEEVHENHRHNIHVATQDDQDGDLFNIVDKALEKFQNGDDDPDEQVTPLLEETSEEEEEDDEDMVSEAASSIRFGAMGMDEQLGTAAGLRHLYHRGINRNHRKFAKTIASYGLHLDIIHRVRERLDEVEDNIVRFCEDRQKRNVGGEAHNLEESKSELHHFQTPGEAVWAWGDPLGMLKKSAFRLSESFATYGEGKRKTHRSSIALAAPIGGGGRSTGGSGKFDFSQVQKLKVLGSMSEEKVSELDTRFQQWEKYLLKNTMDQERKPKAKFPNYTVEMVLCKLRLSFTERLPFTLIKALETLTRSLNVVSEEQASREPIHEAPADPVELSLPTYLSRMTVGIELEDVVLAIAAVPVGEPGQHTRMISQSITSHTGGRMKHRGNQSGLSTNTSIKNSGSLSSKANRPKDVSNVQTELAISVSVGYCASQCCEAISIQLDRFAIGLSYSKRKASSYNFRSRVSEMDLIGGQGGTKVSHALLKPWKGWIDCTFSRDPSKPKEIVRRVTGELLPARISLWVTDISALLQFSKDLVTLSSKVGEAFEQLDKSSHAKNDQEEDATKEKLNGETSEQTNTKKEVKEEEEEEPQTFPRLSGLLSSIPKLVTVERSSPGSFFANALGSSFVLVDSSSFATLLTLLHMIQFRIDQKDPDVIMMLIHLPQVLDWVNGMIREGILASVHYRISNIKIDTEVTYGRSDGGGGGEIPLTIDLIADSIITPHGEALPKVSEEGNGDVDEDDVSLDPIDLAFQESEQVHDEISLVIKIVQVELVREVLKRETEIEAYLPVILFQLEELHFISESFSEFSRDMVLAAYITFEAKFYNHRIGTWEYLIEPWNNVRFSFYVDAENPDTSHIGLNAYSRLNANISEDLLRLLMELREDINSTIEQIANFGDGVARDDGPMRGASQAPLQVQTSDDDIAFSATSSDQRSESSLSKPQNAGPSKTTGTSIATSSKAARGTRKSVTRVDHWFVNNTGVDIVIYDMFQIGCNYKGTIFVEYRDGWDLPNRTRWQKRPRKMRMSVLPFRPSICVGSLEYGTTSEDDHVPYIRKVSSFDAAEDEEDEESDGEDSFSDGSDSLDGDGLLRDDMTKRAGARNKFGQFGNRFVLPYPGAKSDVVPQLLVEVKDDETGRYLTTKISLVPHILFPDTNTTEWFRIESDSLKVDPSEILLSIRFEMAEEEKKQEMENCTLLERRDGRNAAIKPFRVASGGTIGLDFAKIPKKHWFQSYNRHEMIKSISRRHFTTLRSIALDFSSSMDFKSDKSPLLMVVPIDDTGEFFLSMETKPDIAGVSLASPPYSHLQKPVDHGPSSMGKKVSSLPAPTATVAQLRKDFRFNVLATSAMRDRKRRVLLLESPIKLVNQTSMGIEVMVCEHDFLDERTGRKGLFETLQLVSLESATVTCSGNHLDSNGLGLTSLFITAATTKWVDGGYHRPTGVLLNKSMSEEGGDEAPFIESEDVGSVTEEEHQSSWLRWDFESPRQVCLYRITPTSVKISSHDHAGIGNAERGVPVDSSRLGIDPIGWVILARKYFDPEDVDEEDVDNPWEEIDRRENIVFDDKRRTKQFFVNMVDSFSCYKVVFFPGPLHHDVLEGKYPSIPDDPGNVDLARAAYGPGGTVPIGISSFELFEEKPSTLFSSLEDNEEDDDDHDEDNDSLLGGERGLTVEGKVARKTWICSLCGEENYAEVNMCLLCSKEQDKRSRPQGQSIASSTPGLSSSPSGQHHANARSLTGSYDEIRFNILAKRKQTSREIQQRAFRAKKRKNEAESAHVESGGGFGSSMFSSSLLHHSNNNTSSSSLMGNDAGGDSGELEPVYLEDVIKIAPYHSQQQIATNVKGGSVFARLTHDGVEFEKPKKATIMKKLAGRNTGTKHKPSSAGQFLGAVEFMPTMKVQIFDRANNVLLLVVEPPESEQENDNNNMTQQKQKKKKQQQQQQFHPAQLLAQRRKESKKRRISLMRGLDRGKSMFSRTSQLFQEEFGEMIDDGVFLMLPDPETLQRWREAIVSILDHLRKASQGKDVDVAQFTGMRRAVAPGESLAIPLNYIYSKKKWSLYIKPDRGAMEVGVSWAPVFHHISAQALGEENTISDLFCRPIDLPRGLHNANPANAMPFGLQNSLTEARSFSFSVSFRQSYLKSYRADEDETKNGIQEKRLSPRVEIGIKPWVVMMNALPYDILVKFSIDEDAETERMSPGEVMNLCQVEEDAQVRFCIPRLETDWTVGYKLQEFAIFSSSKTKRNDPTSKIQQLESGTSVVFHKSGAASTKLSSVVAEAKIERSRDPNGPLRVVLYAPFWFYNYSDVDLLLAPSKSIVDSDMATDTLLRPNFFEETEFSQEQNLTKHGRVLPFLRAIPTKSVSLAVIVRRQLVAESQARGRSLNQFPSVHYRVQQPEAGEVLDPDALPIQDGLNNWLIEKPNEVQEHFVTSWCKPIKVKTSSGNLVHRSFKFIVSNFAVIRREIGIEVVNGGSNAFTRSTQVIFRCRYLVLNRIPKVYLRFHQSRHQSGEKSRGFVHESAIRNSKWVKKSQFNQFIAKKRKKSVTVPENASLDEEEEGEENEEGGYDSMIEEEDDVDNESGIGRAPMEVEMTRNPNPENVYSHDQEQQESATTSSTNKKKKKKKSPKQSSRHIYGKDILLPPTATRLHPFHFMGWHKHYFGGESCFRVSTCDEEGHELTTKSAPIQAEKENEFSLLLRSKDGSARNEQGAMRVRVSVRVEGPTTFIVFSPDDVTFGSECSETPFYVVRNNSDHPIELWQEKMPRAGYNIVVPPNQSFKFAWDNPCAPHLLCARSLRPVSWRGLPTLDWDDMVYEAGTDFEKLAFMDSRIQIDVADVVDTSTIVVPGIYSPSSKIQIISAESIRQFDNIELIDPTPFELEHGLHKIVVEGYIDSSTKTLEFRRQTTPGGRLDRASSDMTEIEEDENEDEVESANRDDDGANMLKEKPPYVVSLRVCLKLGPVFTASSKYSIVARCGGKSREFYGHVSETPEWIETISFQLQSKPKQCFLLIYRILDSSKKDLVNAKTVPIYDALWHQQDGDSSTCEETDFVKVNDTYWKKVEEAEAAAVFKRQRHVEDLLTHGFSRTAKQLSGGNHHHHHHQEHVTTKISQANNERLFSSWDVIPPGASGSNHLSSSKLHASSHSSDFGSSRPHVQLQHASSSTINNLPQRAHSSGARLVLEQQHQQDVQGASKIEGDGQLPEDESKQEPIGEPTIALNDPTEKEGGLLRSLDPRGLIRGSAQDGSGVKMVTAEAFMQLKCVTNVDEKVRKSTKEGESTINVFLSSVGCSVVHARRKLEVCYIVGQRLSVRLDTFGSTTIFAMSIGNFQIDSHNPRARYQVVIVPENLSPGPNAEGIIPTYPSQEFVTNRKDTLKMEAIFRQNTPTKAGSNTEDEKQGEQTKGYMEIETFTLDIVPLKVSVEELLIGSLLEVISSAVAGQDVLGIVSGAQVIIHPNATSLSFEQASAQSLSDYVYVYWFKISKVVIVFEAKLNGGRNIEAQDQVSLTLKQFVPTLSIDTLRLHFRDFSRSNSFEPSVELQRKLFVHIRNEILFGNATKALTQTTIGVNPLPPIKTILTGAIELVRQPYLKSRPNCSCSGLCEGCQLGLTAFISNLASGLTDMTYAMAKLTVDGIGQVAVASRYDIVTRPAALSFMAVQAVAQAVSTSSTKISTDLLSEKVDINTVRSPRPFTVRGEMSFYGPGNHPIAQEMIIQSRAAALIKRRFELFKQARDRERRLGISMKDIELITKMKKKYMEDQKRTYLQRWGDWFAKNFASFKQEFQNARQGDSGERERLIKN